MVTSCLMARVEPFLLDAKIKQITKIESWIRLESDKTNLVIILWS